MHCRTLHTVQNLRWNANIWLPKYANRHLTSNFGWCVIFYSAISMGTHIFLFNCVNYEGVHRFYHKKCFFHVFEFHLQFWQMCKLFANKLYSINTYFYSPVWIMMVYNNFDAQNLLFICLQISPQIFAIVQNFAMDNLRDQQFCVLLCEL